MREGFVKIWRKFKKWKHFRNSRLVHLYLTILLHTKYEVTLSTAKTTTFRLLSPGQFLTSYSELSRLTGIPLTSVKRHLHLLEGNQIRIEKAETQIVITVLNWHEHQDRNEVSREVQNQER